MRLTFLGANRQVTGSRYLLEAGGLRLMIDCGLFQERCCLQYNWAASPVPPSQVDCVLLTHAHLDHCGLLPKFVREGYSRPVFTTQPSVELTGIVLRDAGRIQEEDAANKKRRHEREGRRGPYPEVPLYTQAEAERSLELLRPVRYREPLRLNKQVTVRFHDAGHILGSAMLEVIVHEDRRERRVLFSGDVGQRGKPLVHDPTVFEQADYVILESTYGDRDHEPQSQAIDKLVGIIHDTVARGGNLVIPTFALERAQELMFHLNRLLHEGRIPHLLVFLDSPMASDATEVFVRHRDWLDEHAQAMFAAGRHPFDFPGLEYVRTVARSKGINRIHGSCIVMAGSGMCTGGRIKHHLVANISRPQSTILFLGYQAVDTLGRQIVDGHPQVRILGQIYPVRARVERLYGFSAHADRHGLLQWLDHLRTAPRRVFLTHGEENAALSLAEVIRKNKSWDVAVPQYRESVSLS